MNAPATVIVASSNAAVSAALAEQLREAGFTPEEVRGEKELASVLAATDGQSVMLYDADAPPPSLAATSTLPVLFLAKNARPEQQPVLAKPVRRTDLINRLGQMVRSSALPASLKLSGDWVLQPAERLLKQQNENHSVALTEKEVQLLACLLCSPARAAPRQKLLEEVWGYGSEINTHTLETHIHRLRAKLKDVGGEGWIAATESGYRISV